MSFFTIHTRKEFSFKRFIVLLIIALVLEIGLVSLYGYIWNKGYHKATSRYQDKPNKITALPSPSPEPTRSYQERFHGAIPAHHLQLSGWFTVTNEGRLQVRVESLKDPLPYTNEEENESNMLMYTPNMSALVFDEKLSQPPEDFLEGGGHPPTLAGIGFNFPMTWANHKNQLVVFTPGKLTYIDVAVDSKNKVSVTNKTEVQLPAQKSNRGRYYRMFYTGDDSKLFISWLGFWEDENKEQMKSYLYSFANKSFTDTTTEINYDSFPIPNSSGIVFWRNANMVVWNKGQSQEYEIKEYEDYDYTTLFSPRGNYICATRGSSGGVQYYVYAFPSMKLIDFGTGYSYCSRWLDNNRVVVRQEQTIYEVNAVTGEKRMIDTLYERN